MGEHVAVKIEAHNKNRERDRQHGRRADRRVRDAPSRDRRRVAQQKNPRRPLRGEEERPCLPGKRGQPDLRRKPADQPGGGGEIVRPARRQHRPGKHRAKQQAQPKDSDRRKFRMRRGENKPARPAQIVWKYRIAHAGERWDTFLKFRKNLARVADDHRPVKVERGRPRCRDEHRRRTAGLKEIAFFIHPDPVAPPVARAVLRKDHPCANGIGEREVPERELRHVPGCLPVVAAQVEDLPRARQRGVEPLEFCQVLERPAIEPERENAARQQKCQRKQRRRG